MCNQIYDSLTYGKLKKVNIYVDVHMENLEQSSSQLKSIRITMRACKSIQCWPSNQAMEVTVNFCPITIIISKSLKF